MRGSGSHVQVLHKNLSEKSIEKAVEKTKIAKTHGDFSGAKLAERQRRSGVGAQIGKTQGRIHDTPPIMSFAAADFDNHGRINAGRIDHSAIAAIGEIGMAHLYGYRERTIVGKENLCGSFHHRIALLACDFQRLRLCGAGRKIGLHIFQQCVPHKQLKSLTLGIVSVRTDMQADNLVRQHLIFRPRMDSTRCE